MIDHTYEQRKYVIAGVALAIVLVYVARLFYLQISTDEYKVRADSNAFHKNYLFPARGQIYDRNGKLLVYNELAYNITVIMMDQHGIDTLDFCRTMGITKDYYIKRMEEIKDPEKNPNYSRNRPQVFMTQVPAEKFSKFREKMSRFNGFSFEKRTRRRYASGLGGHVIGDVAEVSVADIDSDAYYRPGDFIGKLGVERSYEKVLRGEKGVNIYLRDVHGRVQGRYADGKYDRPPVPGQNLTLAIDSATQALAERLLEGKMGAIVAIEPSTGEVLCLASGPSFDPRLTTGDDRGKQQRLIQKNPRKPMLNRAIMGCYPPGSTFKPTQALMELQEGIVQPGEAFPCNKGFNFKGLHLGCHAHPAPISLVPALGTSCNAYFCWTLVRMFKNRKKYKTLHDAMTKWKDYMVDMGYGYKLGIDLPGERRGMIPNADFYDEMYKGKWGALSVVSISIGQGEVTATPLQIANLAATIANRGWYIVPHVAKKIQFTNLAPEYSQKHVVKVDPHWYDYVVQGMRNAVTSGTCVGADIPGYPVCGKTGTAQNRGRDHSAFMGFAPMGNPRIAVAVYIENGGFGAKYGVPIGSLIMEQYLTGKLSPASESRASNMQHSYVDYSGYN